MFLNVEAYERYAHEPGNKWEQVERPILDYAFERFFRTKFNGHPPQDTIQTTFGFPIAKDFQVLDLATGTGRVPGRLIEHGVPAENIVGIDMDERLINSDFFPGGVDRRRGDIRELEELLEPDEAFNFITANMVFHLLGYEDYVRCLRQARRHIKRYRTLALITVPHPLRRVIDTIGGYHAHSTLPETSPWGETVIVQQKTIQDYIRGLYEAGFNVFHSGAYGVGVDDVDSRFYTTDEAVWSRVGKEWNRPPHFRLWLLANLRS